MTAPDEDPRNDARPEEDEATTQASEGSPASGKPEGGKPVRRIVRSRGTRDALEGAPGPLPAPEAAGDDAAASGTADDGGSPRATSSGADAATGSQGAARTGAETPGRPAPGGKRVFDMRVKRPPPPPEDETRRREWPPPAEGMERPRERRRPPERAAENRAAPARPAPENRPLVRTGSTPAEGASENRPAAAKPALEKRPPAESAPAPAKSAPENRPAPENKPAATRPAPARAAAENKPAPAKVEEPKTEGEAAVDEVRRFASVPAPRVLPPPDKKAPTPKEALRAKVAARAQAHAKARGARIDSAPSHAEPRGEASGSPSREPAEVAETATGPSPKREAPRKPKAKKAPPPEIADDDLDVTPPEKPGLFSRILGFFRGSPK